MCFTTKKREPEIVIDCVSMQGYHCLAPREGKRRVKAVDMGKLSGVGNKPPREVLGEGIGIGWLYLKDGSLI